MNSLNIKIGDISTLIKCKNSSFIASAQKDYKGFLSGGKPDYEIEVLRKNVGRNIGSEHRNNKPPFTSLANIALPGFFIGQIEDKKAKITINSVPIFKYFLKILYSYLCLKNDRLLLHGAGIVKNNKGYVFIGPSDSGKTTIAAMSQSYTVLSDEAIIIKGNTVFSTPFSFGTGKFVNTNAKIQGLFRLIKDKNVYLEKLSYGEGFSELMSNLIIFEKKSVKDALPLCENFVKKISCYKLHFMLNYPFWEEIEK